MCSRGDLYSTPGNQSLFGKDSMDRMICVFLGLIRADQPNPRSSAGYRASRWPADERGCDGFSLIECASFY